MSVAYPTDPPVDSIRLLVEMLTGRQEADVKTAALHGWAVQGYCQSLVLGSPGARKAAILSYEDEPRIEDHQAVLALETLAGTRGKKKEMVAQGLVGDVSGKSLKDAIARMLLPVLLQWLEKWLEEGGLQKIIDQIIGKLDAPAE